MASISFPVSTASVGAKEGCPCDLPTQTLFLQKVPIDVTYLTLFPGQGRLPPPQERDPGQEAGKAEVMGTL